MLKRLSLSLSHSLARSLSLLRVFGLKRLTPHFRTSFRKTSIISFHFGRILHFPTVAFLILFFRRPRQACQKTWRRRGLPTEARRGESCGRDRTYAVGHEKKRQHLLDGGVLVFVRPTDRVERGNAANVFRDSFTLWPDEAVLDDRHDVAAVVYGCDQLFTRAKQAQYMSCS